MFAQDTLSAVVRNACCIALEGADDAKGPTFNETAFMFTGFEKIIESRIKKAQADGAFDNLPGSGQPLNLDDDRHIPEDLRMAHKVLKNADFSDAKLIGADLRCADLRDATNLPIEVLTKVKTLYRSQMDERVRKEVETIKGDLFAKPPDTWHDMNTPYNVGRKDICE